MARTGNEGYIVMSRWFIRAALPVLLGVVAFIVVEYLDGSWRSHRTTLEPMLNQPVDALTARHVPLQVAVHDLAESASADTAIRICRSLADRLVRLDVVHPQPLHAVLESLAAQVGSTLTVANTRQRGDRVLPTMLCPDGSGDYLVIGSQARVGR